MAVQKVSAGVSATPPGGGASIRNGRKEKANLPLQRQVLMACCGKFYYHVFPFNVRIPERE